MNIAELHYSIKDNITNKIQLIKCKSGFHSYVYQKHHKPEFRYECKYCRDLKQYVIADLIEQIKIIEDCQR